MRISATRPQTSVNIKRNKNIALQMSKSIKSQISRNKAKWNTQIALSQNAEDKVSSVLWNNNQLLSPHVISQDDKILFK